MHKAKTPIQRLQVNKLGKTADVGVGTNRATPQSGYWIFKGPAVSARRNARKECIHYVCTNSSEPSIGISMTTVFPTRELEKSNLACQPSALGISSSQRGLTDFYPCMGESQQTSSSGRVHKSCHFVTVLLCAELDTSKQSCDPLYFVYALNHCGTLLAAAPIELSEVYSV